MELWQLGAALGVFRGKAEGARGGAGLHGDALIRARVEAHERGEAPPEAGAISSRSMGALRAYAQAAEAGVN